MKFWAEVEGRAVPLEVTGEGGRYRVTVAGDTLELRALINLVAAVSACPMDLNPISGYKTHDLAIEIL